MNRSNDFAARKDFDPIVIDNIIYVKILICN